MDGLVWRNTETWSRHKLRNWTPLWMALGIACGDMGFALAAKAWLPPNWQALLALSGLVGVVAGDRLGRRVGRWHAARQQAAVEGFEQAFPSAEIHHVTAHTVRNALRGLPNLPQEDCLVLVLWVGDTRGYDLRELHVYAPGSEKGFVLLEQTGDGHGASGTPIMAHTGRRWWGAKPHMHCSFVADLPLASAHQRLACAAWLERTRAEDANTHTAHLAKTT